MMVTTFPPAKRPLEGERLVTVGGGRYVKRSAEEVVLVPPGVVTVTSTVPADSAGTVAIKLVELVALTPVAGVVPNVTVTPGTKPDPVMVTAFPPAKGPLWGTRLVTVGVGK